MCSYVFNHVGVGGSEKKTFETIFIVFPMFGWRKCKNYVFQGHPSETNRIEKDYVLLHKQSDCSVEIAPAWWKIPSTWKYSIFYANPCYCLDFLNLWPLYGNESYLLQLANNRELEKKPFLEKRWENRSAPITVKKINMKLLFARFRKLNHRPQHNCIFPSQFLRKYRFITLLCFLSLFYLCLHR